MGIFIDKLNLSISNVPNGQDKQNSLSKYLVALVNTNSFCKYLIESCAKESFVNLNSQIGIVESDRAGSNSVICNKVSSKSLGLGLSQ